MKIILIACCLFKVICGAPIMGMVHVPGTVYAGMNYPDIVLPYQQRPKIFWNSIGDWISGSNWFPIEVNVPDVINNVVSGVSGIVGSNAQRLPIINRITSGERPRPFNYYMVIPMDPDQIPYSVYP